AELLAVTRVEPAVGQVDAGVGQVRQIATGLLEGGLATDVTPDDAQLLAIAEAAQAARQCVLVLARGALVGQLGTQLARSQGALQLAGLSQGHEHQRITLRLLEYEVAERCHPSPRLATGWRPTLPLPAQLVVLNQNALQRMLGALTHRLQERGQFDRQRQAHGLSFWADCQPLVGGSKPRRGGARWAGGTVDCSFTTKDLSPKG